MSHIKYASDVSHASLPYSIPNTTDTAIKVCRVYSLWDFNAVPLKAALRLCKSLLLYLSKVRLKL